MVFDFLRDHQNVPVDQIRTKPEIFNKKKLGLESKCGNLWEKGAGF